MMKSILLLFLFSFNAIGLLSDESKLSSGTDKPKQQDNSFDDDEDLDKVFYQYYFFQKEPDLDDLQKEQNSTLKQNLIKAMKDEVFIRDPSNLQKAKEEIEKPDAKLKFKQVYKYSPWMKKIKREIGYIVFTDYMYIIQFQDYIALVLYQVDPKKHPMSPIAVELVIKKEPKKQPFDYQ
jgi:hypothetical protein